VIKQKKRTKVRFPMPQPGQIGLSPREVCAITGFGLSKIRAAIQSGELPARCLGSRRHVIRREDAEAFMKNLPPARTEARL
jgi:excisionase family DNA binding protein